VPSTRSRLAAVAMTIGLAGCGASTSEQQAESASAAPADTGRSPEQALARSLDGIYGAELDARALRKALKDTKPAVHLPGGWWTVTIDVGAHRLNIADPDGNSYEQRITAVDASHIELAPDTSCEQRGAARNQPARLAWFKAGALLRFSALSVPCLTDRILLTSTAWLES
jgi:hypothetical protein